jgi:hypothetical protein
LDRVLSALSDKFAQAPITSMQLELQVGVTEDDQNKDILKFAILDMGANSGYTRESIQKLTLNLEAPAHPPSSSDSMPLTRGQDATNSHAELDGNAADGNSAKGAKSDKGGVVGASQSQKGHSDSSTGDNSKDERATVWTAKRVRFAIALVAFLFPFALPIGYLMLAGQSGAFRPTAVSDYYYTQPMQYAYMAGLFILGLLLIRYQIPDREGDRGLRRDNFWLTTFAGLFALGIVLFPEDPPYPQWTPGQPANIFALGYFQFPDPPLPLFNATPSKAAIWQQNVSNVHALCLAGLFVCTAFMVIFFFSRPAGPLPWNPFWMKDKSLTEAELKQALGGPTSPKRLRNWVYFFLGILMAVCGALIGLIYLKLIHNPPTSLFYWGEAVTFVSFALAWAIKARVFPRLNDNKTKWWDDVKKWWLAVRSAIAP